MARRSGYDTNLASEFYVMSVLHRLGLEAHLTLGNKKAVDIVVVRAPGDTITIDVKGVAGSVDWLVGNAGSEPRERHFVILISYNGKIGQVDALPQCWILPHLEFLQLVKNAKSPSKMEYISRAAVRKLNARAENWSLLSGKD
jgi:hypothetical protein